MGAFRSEHTHTQPDPQPDRHIEPEGVYPVVVGAHPWAERHERPVAQRVAQRIADAFQTTQPRPEPLLCTDLWYLNDDALRARPTVCIGHPSTNALSATLADTLPSVLTVDGSYVVQLDPHLLDLVVCCWGATPHATHAAADAFLERWLTRFLDAAHP